MAAKSFYASGTTPRRSDSQRVLWLKLLVAVQNAKASPDAANDPKRNDPPYRLKFKLTKARTS